MTLGFVFKTVRKSDGKAQLYIRFKDGTLKRKDNDKRIKVDGVFVLPKLWNKTFSRVEPSHDNSAAINDKLDKYWAKMKDVKNKYTLGQIDFDTAAKMLSSSESAKSIKEYIRTVFSQYKKPKHVKNCMDTVITVGNHLGITDLLFSDVTEINLLKVRNKLKNEGKSLNTFNTYLTNLKTVCNHAVEKKYLYQDFSFGKDLKNKVPPMPVVHSASPDDIYRAIDNIIPKTKRSSSHTTALRKVEAVGFWLLMFAMRGFYQEDIHDLTSHDLDYDFEREIDSIKKGYKDDKIIGRKEVYMHRRHKGEYPMNMLMLPPIENLISFLRKLIALTHPHISFYNVSDLAKSKEEIIKSKSMEDVDFLKIFAITNTGSPNLFDNTWRLFRKKAKEIGLPKFKEARKTFMSISDELGIPDSYGRALIGQNEPTISKFYKDMSRPRIVGKLAYYHLAILREFDTINIFNYLIDHLCNNLLAPEHRLFFYMHRVNQTQDELYKAYENITIGLLEKRDIKLLEI
jgi:hypothetical protein